jgi:hypothetical protein
MWDGTNAPLNLSITGNVDYTYVNSEGDTEVGSYPINTPITLKGIPSTVTFNNPQLNIQKCCTENVTYTMWDVGDADDYEWTYPTGWTVVGANNQKSITLKPLNNNGGVVKCKMRLSCSPSSYFREKQITITRSNPTVILTAGAERGTNEFSGICPLRTYVYKIDPASKVCGATHFTWSFPTSWQVNYGQIGGGPPPQHIFYVSGQTSSEVTIQTSQNPGNGSISVTAHFNNCASVSASLPVNILTAPPASIDFKNQDYEYFHCGEWKMCATGGQIPLNVVNADKVDYYSFTINPPRYFTSPNGPVQQKTIYYGDADFGKTPLIQGGGAPSQLVVSATNCIGTSSQSSITIVDEDPAWCPGSPFWQPYPIGCECCEPSGDPNPKKKEDQLTRFKLVPNPTSGVVLITLPENGKATVNIYTLDGKLIDTFEQTSQNLEYRLPDALRSGLYILRITQNDAQFVERINLLR